MSGNRARRRAGETGTVEATRMAAADAGDEVPLIVDTTELIDPEKAQEMLKANKRNRPMNWNKVEIYAKVMAAGKWELHAQGIILDGDGNILTGQKRLMAVVYSGRAVLFRVSRGTPASSAHLLDRGTPQSARDLASRETERKHSQVEASIARSQLILGGNLRPDTDTLAQQLVDNDRTVKALLKDLNGTKKTRPVVMVCACVLVLSQRSIAKAHKLSKGVPAWAEKLEKAIMPIEPKDLRGQQFGLAMDKAQAIVGDGG